MCPVALNQNGSQFAYIIDGLISCFFITNGNNSINGGLSIMINDHCAGKSLQSVQNIYMIKPTLKDLIFDFSPTGFSICVNCSNLKRCQVAFLLNVAVVNCAYFQEDAFLFGEVLENSAVAQKSLSF
jgi:hypothetical protein